MLLASQRCRLDGAVGNAGGVQATRCALVRRRGARGVVALGLGDQVVAAEVTFPRERHKVNEDGKQPVPSMGEDVHVIRCAGQVAPAGRVQSVESGCHSDQASLVGVSNDQGGGMLLRFLWDEGTAASLQGSHAQGGSKEKRRKISDSTQKVQVAFQWEGILGQSGGLRGWSGVSFAKGSSKNLAVTASAAQVTRVIDIETGKESGRVQHALPPSAISHFDANSIIVAEWGTLSLWDVRTSSAIKPSKQLPYDRTPYFGVDAQEHLVGAVGEARLVNLLDSRTWKPFRSWKVAIKHDAVGIKLTKHSCFIAGLDHELVCCPINTKKDSALEKKKTFKLNAVPQSVPEGSMLHQNHRMFRSESMWAGFDIDWQQLDTPLSGSSSPSSSSSESSLIECPFVGLACSGILYTGSFSEAQ